MSPEEIQGSGSVNSIDALARLMESRFNIIESRLVGLEAKIDRIIAANVSLLTCHVYQRGCRFPDTPKPATKIFSSLRFVCQKFLLRRGFIGLPDRKEPGVFAIPFDAIPVAIRIPVDDLITGNGALVPGFDLAQHALDIVGD